MSAAKKMNLSSTLVLSSNEHFQEMVDSAFEKRKVKASFLVKNYIVDVLVYFLDIKNLYSTSHLEKEAAATTKDLTLAEEYLISMQKSGFEKVETLKKLADKSLYISGFFSDSFQRKLIDVDYYVDLGCSAYGELSGYAKKEDQAEVYKTMSGRFVEFVDVLTFISQEAFIQSNKDILRLYDRFMKTKSELAREKLIEMGVLTLDSEQLKHSKQN